MARMDHHFRLAEGDAVGLTCGLEGLSLAGAPLLRKTARGWEPRPTPEIEALIKAAYEEDFHAPRLAWGLDVIAKALNTADLGRAGVAAVQLKLPNLGPDDAERVAKAEDSLAKYDSTEPRDERGRWMTGGGSQSDSSTPNAGNVSDRVEPGGSDKPTVVPVSDRVYPNVTAFRNKHLADAIKLAAVIGHGATPDEVLAVSGNESTYEEDYKAWKQGNYFGIHSIGTNPSKFYQGQTGAFYTSKGKLMAQFGLDDAFYQSGLIFAKTMARFSGSNDFSKPEALFTLAHAHGWGADTNDYVSTLKGVYDLFRNSARSGEKRL